MENYLTPPASPTRQAPPAILQSETRLEWPWPHGDICGFDWIDALELTDAEEVVMLISTEFLEATATWVEYRSLHISEYYVPSAFHTLLRYIFRVYAIPRIQSNGELASSAPRPGWVTREPSWRVVRRDFAVRQVAHSARKPFNMIMAERMRLWAEGVTTHPNSLYHFAHPSRLIWPASNNTNPSVPTAKQLEDDRRRRETRRDHEARESIP